MKSKRQQNNPRFQAYQVLKSVIADGQSLTQALSSIDQMSAFAKAMCFGTMRDYYRLSVIIRQLLAKKPKKKSLEILLMIGIFQLLSSDKPDYASVNETVSLSRDINLGWASATVNAVLRRFAQQKEAILAICQQDASYQHNHPDWLVNWFCQAWPDQVTKLLVANDQQAPMSLRVNMAKVSRADYRHQLETNSIQSTISDIGSQAIVLDNPVDVDELPGFNQGLVSVQDEAAQLAAPLLQLQPNQRVLDACAAPGGKTCHILETEPNVSELVALDVSEARLEKVQQNLTRLGLSANLVCGDAIQIDQWWDERPFDSILLDAPCSATGVIRRHPDIKYHRKPEDIVNLVAIQAQLLESLWLTLKPGGLLVYATCSVLPEENDIQVGLFCQNHDDALLEDICIGLPSASQKGLQLFPTMNSHDGFYYAVIRKKR